MKRDTVKAVKQATSLPRDMTALPSLVKEETTSATAVIADISGRNDARNDVVKNGDVIVHGCEDKVVKPIDVETPKRRRRRKSNDSLDALQSIPFIPPHTGVRGRPRGSTSNEKKRRSGSNTPKRSNLTKQGYVEDFEYLIGRDHMDSDEENMIFTTSRVEVEDGIIVGYRYKNRAKESIFSRLVSVQDQKDPTDPTVTEVAEGGSSQVTAVTVEGEGQAVQGDNMMEEWGVPGREEEEEDLEEEEDPVHIQDIVNMTEKYDMLCNRNVNQHSNSNSNEEGDAAVNHVLLQLIE